MGDISGVSYSAPSLGDQWMGAIYGQAAQMNAGGGRGGGGGGGAGGLPGIGSGGYIQKSFEGDYDNPQLDLQRAQQQIQNQHWNQAFGLLSGRIGSNPNPFYNAAKQVGSGPTINANPVWNPQQIQQNVNLSNAKSDAAAAAQERSNDASVVGRGFGGSSPVLAAMTNSTQNANQAAKSANETNFRSQAAQANATQQLNAQQAQSQQWANQQNAITQRGQPYFQQQNALIAALASMA